VTEPPSATAEDSVASPEATLDSSRGTDSIGTETAGQEPPPSDTFAAPPPSAAPPERRTSAAALIGSGLLGGLIGAGVVYALQVWQQPPDQGDQRLTQLEQRINTLGRSGPAPVNLQPIEGRLQALEAARGQLDQRLQALQSAAEQANARAEEAANRPQPEASAPQNEAALNQLSERLSALEGQVQTGLRQASEAANAAQALDRRLSEEGTRLTQQDQRLAALSQQVTQNSQNVEAAGQTSTRVVLTERLNDALRNGTPYADVLEGLRKSGADPEKLKALEPFAEKGAPTSAALLNGFEPLEAQILRDQRAASGDWSDRLLRMMDKVVTVRPVNEEGASGVGAGVARIRQALAWGDMGGAAAAWAALPEPSRRISEEWGRQVTALAGAQQASRELSNDALAALNRSTQ
jgi:hypothetical protein